MESSVKLIVTITVVFFATTTAVSARINATSSGICEIEVPTINILPPELKHTAGSIRGNGTSPGFSKIKICCSGYKVAPHSPFHCIPDCPNGCGHGNCTAPNVCTCPKGTADGPHGKCINICPKSCLNGQCYGTYCNCNSGFLLEPGARYCVSGCTRNCGPGGQCFGNNQCKCNTGYQMNPSGACEIFCNQGFKPVGNTCEPQCPKGCQDGECIAPGKCACKQGYTMSADGTACIPKCSMPCYNGVCSAPNVCSCKQGYIKPANDPHSNKCTAHCVHGCPNGFCTAPNFCLCNQGYVKQSKGSNVCIKRT